MFAFGAGFKSGSTTGTAEVDGFQPGLPPSGFQSHFPPSGLKLGVTQSDSKRLDAPPSGFKLNFPPSGFKLDFPPGGFKLDLPQKAESSSTLAGLKFSFGTPTTKASTVSPGFFLCGSTPATSAARPSGFGASAKDSAAEDSGFPSGKPQAAAASAEKKPESSSALLEQLLTSDDPPETTQRSIFGAASPGGAFVSTADGSKPSGFQVN